MAKESFRDKPFLYKLISILLRIASTIVILLVVFFAINFMLETPFYRVFDGIAISQLIRMVLVLIAVIFLFVCFRKPYVGGVSVTLIIIAYTLMESLENKAYTAGVLNYIMLGLALSFILLGIVKKHLEHDRLDEIMGPKIEKNEGPNLMDLHL